MSESAFSRRGFLKTGAGAALLLVGYQAARHGLVGDEDYRLLLAGEVPQALSIKEFAVLSSVVRCLVGPAQGVPTTEETRTTARIDRELMIHGGKLLQDLKDSLLVVEHGTFLEGYGERFSRLNAAQQSSFLQSCRNSSLDLRRQVYSGLRFLTMFFYYSDDRSWPLLGYQGPWQAIKFYEGGNRIENLAPLSTLPSISNITAKVSA